MAFLGLDFFKSKEEKERENKVYSLMVFPYGDRQKEKIQKILQELFIDQTSESLMYNYIVTKQKIENLDIYSLSKEEKIELLSDLNAHYITYDNDASLYLVLADCDLKINKELNYPSINSLTLKADIYLKSIDSLND